MLFYFPYTAFAYVLFPYAVLADVATCEPLPSANHSLVDAYGIVAP